jgi:hypothetical protein
MAWLDIAWSLNAWRFNEKDDEQGLQFAVVLIDLSRRWVGVQTHLTGDMSNLGRQVFGGRIQIPAFEITGRGWVGIPDAQKPYLGLVVRAIEYDNSSKGNREADTNNFINAIKDGVQAIVNQGRTPTSHELLSFATSVGLKDRRWRDDDDLIGVRATSYPDFGVPVDIAFHRDARQAFGSTFYLGFIQGGRFEGEDAIWNITTWPQILTGTASESDAQYNTQQRGGWWLFTPPDWR